MIEILIRLSFVFGLFVVWGASFAYFMWRLKKNKPQWSKGRQQGFAGFYATCVFIMTASIIMRIAWVNHWI